MKSLTDTGEIFYMLVLKKKKIVQTMNILEEDH